MVNKVAPHLRMELINRQKNKTFHEMITRSCVNFRRLFLEVTLITHGTSLPRDWCLKISNGSRLSSKIQKDRRHTGWWMYRGIYGKREFVEIFIQIPLVWTNKSVDHGIENPFPSYSLERDRVSIGTIRKFFPIIRQDFRGQFHLKITTSWRAFRIFALV